MKIFISGGCKNGKSTYAEQLAVYLHNQKPDTPLYYIATMRPVDGEDQARIVRHRESRAGLGFETVEQQHNISDISVLYNVVGAFLLDSTTALLANEMFLPDGQFCAGAGKKVTRDLAILLKAVEDIVIVSDYIYSDAAEYDEYTECYRQALSMIDREAARICDTVIEVCYSNMIVHKGVIPWLR